MNEAPGHLPEPTPEFETGREAHIVYLLPGDEALNEAASGLFDSLPLEERNRAATFKSLIARRQFLFGRLLLRRCLSRYLDLAPERLVLEPTEDGKLFLPDQPGAIEFNLTHKPGCIAAAFVKGSALGLDAEAYEPDRANAKIARRYFSPAEVAQLEGLEGETLAWRFYRFWTLKEAYIKARGLGLKLPLRDFSFFFDDPEALEQTGEGVRIAFSGKIEDRPEDWQFQTKRVSDRHLISVAVQPGPAGWLGLRYFSTGIERL